MEILRSVGGVEARPVVSAVGFIAAVVRDVKAVVGKEDDGSVVGGDCNRFAMLAEKEEEEE